MGARGPVGRPGEHHHGHRDRRVVELVNRRPETVVPKPPAGLLAATRRAWERYWQSDVATVATGADHDLVERLFVLRDEHARVLRALRSTGERMVSGSRQQPRLSPLFDLLFKLEASIHVLENELGLSPLARARLGIAVGAAKLTAAELNRITRDRPHHDDEDEEDADEYEDA
jgi:P27 family predicted phage terminase small subunit